LAKDHKKKREGEALLPSLPPDVAERLLSRVYAESPLLNVFRRAYDDNRRLSYTPPIVRHNRMINSLKPFQVSDIHSVYGSIEREDTEMLYGNVRNPIFQAFFQGWRSDSLTLQKAGWQIACQSDRDPISFGNILRFAIYHPKLKLYGLSMARIHTHDIVAASANLRDHISRLPVSFDLMCKEIVFDGVCEERFRESWYALDARPQRVYGAPNDQSGDRVDLHNVWPFTNPHLPQADQIIVDPQDVDRMLNLILEQQAPKQREIREKYRWEQQQQERLERRVHAEIISVKEVA
jgi:hypothetical protein